MKVFLDTNVLVSAFATRGLSAELFELVLLEHKLICSRSVLNELRKALRGKVKLPAVRCTEILRFIAGEADLVVAEARPAECNADAADRQVLGDALAGGAEAFITGDAALVALGSVGALPILTPRQFWERLARERR